MKIIKDLKTIPDFADGSLVLIADYPYRVLSHDMLPGNKPVVWLIKIHTNVFKIIKMDLEYLMNEVSKGNICAGRDDDEVYDPIPILKPGDKKITDLRYLQIKQCVNAMYPDYTVLQKRGYKDNPLVELAENCGIRVCNIRKYVLRFLQEGGTYASVVDHRLMRNIYNSDPYKGSVRGRKRHGISSSVLNNDKLFAIYEETFNSFLKIVNEGGYDRRSKHRPTLSDVYASMIAKYFSEIDENGKVTILPEEECPSYMRFYRYVTKRLLQNGKIREHSVSQRNRRNDSRIIVGDSTYGVYNPLELVEIDEMETPVDIVSVNPGTPGQTIGHAIVYTAVDVLTKRIVGSSVALTNNSYEGFLNLIDSMMMSDEDNAMMFESEYTGPVFPGEVLPHAIRVDHGSEYTSHSLSNNLTGGSETGVLDGLPIDVNIVPVALGSMKGNVERFFGKVHTHIQGSLNSKNGYVTGTHGSKHKEQAMLTITDLRKIVYELIKEHNSALMTDYPLTPKLKSEVPYPTPNLLWDYFSRNRLCGFDVSDPEIKSNARYGFMLKNKTFSLSRKQISYGNVLYWDIDEDKNLMSRAIGLGDRKETIEVRYDPRSTNLIYRKDPKSGKIYVYPLSKKHQNMDEFRHMRWSDAQKVIDEIRKDRTEMKHMKERQKIMTRSNIENIVKEAKEIKGTVENKVTDRKEYRDVEAAALTAFDSARRHQLLFGEEEEKEVYIQEIEAYEEPEEIVPELDITDFDALVRAYGIKEE